MIRVLVDGDNCHNSIRTILIKAAAKDACRVITVSDRQLSIVPSRNFSCIQVDQGADAADRFILNTAGPGDIVITRDLVFAQQCAGRAAVVMNDRGTVFTEETARKAVRKSNDKKELQNKYNMYFEPDTFNSAHRKSFADSFSRELAILQNKINRGDV